jgi:hypothetical protein
MAEHLFCKQVVAGSTPVAGSTLTLMLIGCNGVRGSHLETLLPDGVMVAQQILNLFV